MAAERDRQRRLEEATVLFVQPGEMQSERDFNMQGDNTSVVGRNVTGRPGRQGRNWFSFDLPLKDAAGPIKVLVTYHADQRRTRTFDVLLDGQRIGQQVVGESSTPRFFDVEYALPAEIVRGKEKVTIRFQATNGNEIAAVYGIRVIRLGITR